jgi:hypothetical protein
MVCFPVIVGSPGLTIYVELYSHAFLFVQAGSGTGSPQLWRKSPGFDGSGQAQS